MSEDVQPHIVRSTMNIPAEVGLAHLTSSILRIFERNFQGIE